MEISYTYDSVTKRLTTITTESSTYRFTYDVFGNTSSIGVQDRTLASYTYHPNNGKLETLTYGNGDKVKYLYDALDRVKEICYNTGENGAWQTVYSYEYTGAGALAKAHDHRGGKTTFYVYDTLGKLISSYVYNTADGQIDIREDMIYDDKDRLTQTTYRLPYAVGTAQYPHSITYNYTYNDATGNLSGATFTSGNLTGSTVIGYDVLHRLTSREFTFN